MKRFMPIDIHRKEFQRVIRGYNVRQVDEFLDMVMRDYEDLLKENEQLKALLNQPPSSQRMAVIERGRKDRLTPYDIHMKEFKRSFRGYDEDEVNGFLDLVIQHFEDLIKENEEMKNRLQGVQ